MVGGQMVHHCPTGGQVDELDGLLTQALNEAGQIGAADTAEVPKETPSHQGGAIAKLRYSHDAMVDLILAEPWISQNDLAAKFGYSASWVSQIIASDAFQAKYAERSKALVDPAVLASVNERFRGMVLRSQEILMTKLGVAAKDVPDNLALRTLELSSRALGYGAVPAAPPAKPAEIHLHLEAMGEQLTGLIRRKRSEVAPTEAEVIPQTQLIQASS